MFFRTFESVKVRELHNWSSYSNMYEDQQIHTKSGPLQPEFDTIHSIRRAALDQPGFDTIHSIRRAALDQPEFDTIHYLMSTDTDRLSCNLIG